MLEDGFWKTYFTIWDGLGIIWKYAIEIIYLLISVAGIASFVKKMYIGDDTNENKKDSVKGKNSKRIEKCKTDNTSSNSFSNVLIVLLRCVWYYLLLCLLYSVFSSVCLSNNWYRFIDRESSIFRIFLCMLTYLILNFLFLDLSFKFIFNKN